MNAHDSEKISGILESGDLLETNNPEEADLIVINTCSVRKKAEDKFYSHIGRFKTLKHNKPTLKIAVAGCLAQQEGARIKKSFSQVDYIIGPQNIHVFKNIDTLDRQVFTSDNPEIDEFHYNIHRKNPVKALVNIMYGCNNFCSYCIVPYTRGREKSRASMDILNEIKVLSDKGYKEVMLLGQNVNSYKADITFTELLSRIEDIEGIQRVRFMTSHPKDLSDELIVAFGRLKKLCEHIHLPLQSGSSRILDLMKRKYNYEEYLEKIYKLRTQLPNIAITSDIITGFPQETEDDHAKTLQAIKEIRFDGLFTFKYSIRPNTSAANLAGHIEEAIKDRRLQEINKTQDEITEANNKELVGKYLEIMIDGPSDKSGFNYIGRTRSNKIVYLITDNTISYGSIVNVLIKKANMHSLETELVNR